MAPNKPTRLYKFLNARYADGMMQRGIIRIGTAQEYRVPDGREGARSDALELARVWQPGKTVITTTADHPFRKMLRKDEPVERDVPIDMVFEEGTKILSTGNAWIYSASEELTDGLRKRMADDFDADACIRIGDATEFAKAISAHPSFQKFDYYGNPLRYVPSYDSKGFSSIDPFAKLFEFRWQKEFRLVWDDKDAPAEGVVIEVPAITPLLKRVY